MSSNEHWTGHALANDGSWFTSCSKMSPSQAIPIPRKPHRTTKVVDRYLEENELSAQARRHYELATWRMYDRIVVYRQTHPFGQQYNSKKHVSASESMCPAMESLSSTSQDTIVDESETSEEGIFDLELWIQAKIQYSHRRLKVLFATFLQLDNSFEFIEDSCSLFS